MQALFSPISLVFILQALLLQAIWLYLGRIARNRYLSDIMTFREKFETIKFAHAKRVEVLGPQPKTLPASHTEKLTVWQQNFLESWRRTKKRLEACVKAKVSWSEVKHSIETDEDFRRAFKDTEEVCELATNPSQGWADVAILLE